MEESSMWLIVSQVLLWVFVLALGFLLLGALRALGVTRWRLEQLEATTPSRLGRNGLKPGKKAPDFTLPSVAGTEVSLSDFAGRPVLLVFVQPGCGPCREITPELNRLQGKGEVQVLVVSNGDGEANREWAGEVRANFPVLAQGRLSLSRRYEAFATPFAFLIDGEGVIRSAGIVNSRQHIGFVLAGRGNAGKAEPIATGPTGAEDGMSPEFLSRSNAEEFGHA
jgi:methylamine dehydrogenase accessory protein MauD